MEVDQALRALRTADGGFRASAALMFERPPHLLPADHELPQALASAVARRGPPKMAGMSFWTDAAILARAGIPAVLFGPGGEGLHGPDEYVRLDDVLICRDVLADFARSFCARLNVESEP
jgi:acetylornithine deacetylase